MCIRTRIYTFACSQIRALVLNANTSALPNCHSPETHHPPVPSAFVRRLGARGWAHPYPPHVSIGYLPSHQVFVQSAPCTCGECGWHCQAGRGDVLHGAQW